MTPCDEIMFGIGVLHMQRLPGQRLGMKTLPCDGPRCATVRIHHERPDTDRGIQMCEVRSNHTGPVFCSLNCYFYWKGCEAEKKEKENDETV